MIKDVLDIDEKDIIIMKSFMHQPYISQGEIAEKIGLSQPSVFVRIHKLRERGLLDAKVGINFNKTKLFLSRIDLTAQNPNKLLEDMGKCPFYINGFIMSGENNLSLMMVHYDLKKINEIVDTHLRINPTVTNIKVNIVVSSAKDCAIQLDLGFELEGKEDCYKQGGCRNCSKLN